MDHEYEEVDCTYCRTRHTVKWNVVEFADVENGPGPDDFVQVPDTEFCKNCNNPLFHSMAP